MDTLVTGETGQIENKVIIMIGQAEGCLEQNRVLLARHGMREEVVENN